MAGYYNFVDLEELTGDQLQSYLMSQVVPRFASNVELAAAITAPEEGQLAWTATDGLVIRQADVWLPFGAIGPAGEPGPEGPVGPTGPAGPQGQAADFDGGILTDLVFYNSGMSLRLTEGGNAKQGVVTLAAGGAVVNCSVQTNSRIQLTAQELGTVVLPSALAVSTRDAFSFTILASQPDDTSLVAWFITDPA